MHFHACLKQTVPLSTLSLSEVSDWEKKGEQCEIVNKNLDQSNAYEVLEERDTLVTSSEQNNNDIILEELYIHQCDLEAASASKM